MDKLSLDHDNPHEELIQVTDSLIPSPTMEEEEKTATQEKQMLRQVTNKRGKNMNYDRKSMWASSALRRAIQAQTIQASAIKTDKNIFQSVHLYNLSVKKC